MENLEDYGIDDLVHDLVANLPDDKVEDDNAFVVLNDSRCAIDEIPFVAYQSSLLQLAPDQTCKRCGKLCDREIKRVGSAVVLLWVCQS